MDEPQIHFPTLVALVLVGLLLLYVWQRPDFVIRVRGGECRCKGKLPLVAQKAVSQFLLDDLRPKGSLTICGKRHAGRLRLSFWGKLTSGEKQRIRNFLMTHR